MPLYDLQCPDCGAVGEHLLGMDDKWIIVKCHSCGKNLTRGDNKKYAGMKIQIQGDTVAGGCNYNYYDENLGRHIHSKQHRADEMKRQGVVDYSPNPEMKAHRDEQKYIKNNSKPGDADAARAIRKEKKAAQTKRMVGSVNRAFAGVKEPSLNGLGD